MAENGFNKAVNKFIDILKRKSGKKTEVRRTPSLSDKLQFHKDYLDRAEKPGARMKKRAEKA